MLDQYLRSKLTRMAIDPLVTSVTLKKVSVRMKRVENYWPSFTGLVLFTDYYSLWYQNSVQTQIDDSANQEKKNMYKLPCQNNLT